MTIERQGASLLHALKLPQLLERFGSGEMIAATDPAVLALHTTATAHRRQLAAVLDLSPGKLPTGTLRNLLRAIGWRLERVGRLKTRTKGERDVCTYTAAPIPLPEEVSWEALTAKWLEELRGTVTPEVETMTHVYVIDCSWFIAKCQVVRRTFKTITLLRGYKTAESEQTYRIANEMVYETWKEAHAAMLEKAELAVQNARLNLERAKGRAGQIRRMKPPADESSS